MAPYRDVQSGASLLLAHSPARSDFRSTCLLIGAGALAAARATACLDAGYRIVCLPSSDAAPDPELGWRAKRGELELLDRLEDGDGALGRWLDDEAHADMVDDIAFVVLTDTIASAAGQPPRSAASAAALRRTCFKRRLALSVADMPSLSDFSFPATHRFPLAHGKGASPLQLALTTNSSSCRLAARLRRTLVAALPRDVGSAVVRIRDLRAAVRAEQAVEDEEGEDESWSSRGPLNKPVEQLVGRHTPPLTPPNTPPAVDRSFVPPPALVRANTQDEPALTALTRMRFIAQISEYWPLERIASMDATEVARVLGSSPSPAPSVAAPRAVSPCRARRMAGLAVTAAVVADGVDVPAASSASVDGASSAAKASNAAPSEPSDAITAPRHDIALDDPTALEPSRRGRIILLGSGPGSPGLLTVAAHELLTRRATCVLSDKLVPASILALIPPHIPLVIAKKFPGNAEGAQSELMELGLEAAQRGETVVRLKQGDPLLFGRGGEEVIYFRQHGFEPVLVPGISSAFAAPALAGIPVTQRGVAESVIVCTGVGRAGRGVTLPGYERSRCLVILMGVARLRGVVHALTSAEGLEEHGRDGGGGRGGVAYPPWTPIAIIERASSKDQRVISSTLDRIADAMDRVEAMSGGQRPPGMMVVGWSVLALHGAGDLTVLDAVDDAQDRARVDRWLDGRDYLEREGLPDGWDFVETAESGIGAPSAVGPDA